MFLKYTYWYTRTTLPGIFILFRNTSYFHKQPGRPCYNFPIIIFKTVIVWRKNSKNIQQDLDSVSRIQRLSLYNWTSSDASKFE